jgi:hypothetical protein
MSLLLVFLLLFLLVWANSSWRGRPLVNKQRGSLFNTDSSNQTVTIVNNDFREQAGALVFGANIGVSGGDNISRNQIVNQLKAGNVKETALWIYLPDYVNPSTQRLLPEKLLQFVNIYTAPQGGLEVRVHIMPQKIQKGGFNLPEDLNTYSQQVRDIVRILKSQIKYYSISNESPVLWGGSLEDYLTLLRTSASAIKSEDPEAVVLDSGLESGQLGLMVANSYYQQGQINKTIDFLNGYFNKNTTLAAPLKTRLPLARNDESGLKSILQLPLAQEAVRFGNMMFTDLCPYYDQLQLHYYSQWQYLPEVINFISGQMAAFQCQKPIQFWELGYGLDLDLPYDVNDHALAVPKYLTIAATASDFINYFTFYDRGTIARGLYKADGGSKPTATSFNITTGKLSGAVFDKQLDLGSNVLAYQFTKSGKNIYVVWGTGQATIKLPEAANTAMTATVYNGETAPINPLSVSVSEKPLFIEVQ